MGVSFSGPRGCIIKNERMPHVSKCVPYTKYKPISVNKRKSAGELVSIIKALPTVTRTINDCYWWLNCQFIPNDDTSLLVTSVAYQLRNGLSNLHVKNIPIGRVCRFYLDSPKLKCEVIGRTSSETCPKLQIHPDSFYVFYLCINEIKIFHVNDNTGIQTKAMEPSFRQYRSFALSPDGNRTCILARQGKIEYDLIIFGVNVYTYSESSIHCTKLNKDFRGTPVRTELVDCKWSPDSSCVAVSISTGYLMVLDIKSGHIVCSIFPDILEDSNLSSVSAFDFDPRSCRQIMAVGSSDGHLYIVNTEDKDIVCKSDRYKRDAIDAIQYSHEGNTLGVAFHSFLLHLYSSNTCDLVYTINMVDSCPELDSLPSQGNYPFIMKIIFSQSGEQLVTCCSDGNIRIWQLPVTINLKFMCKLRILSLVFQGNIKSLPLPTILKDYLSPLPSSP